MSIHTFITDLQNSDDRTKVKWLVIFTVATLAVIVGLWLLLTPSQTATNSTELVRTEDQPTFLQKIGISFGNSVDYLRRKTANALYFFQQKFSKTNTIEIKPEGQVESPSSP